MMMRNKKSDPPHILSYPIISQYLRQTYYYNFKYFGFIYYIGYT